MTEISDRIHRGFLVHYKSVHLTDWRGYSSQHRKKHWNDSRNCCDKKTSYLTSKIMHWCCFSVLLIIGFILMCWIQVTCYVKGWLLRLSLTFLMSETEHISSMCTFVYSSRIKCIILCPVCVGMKVKPCNGEAPLVDPDTRREYDCGSGPNRQDCPSGSYCHQTPHFARCCKKGR